jgi:hypothetical protein
MERSIRLCHRDGIAHKTTSDLLVLFRGSGSIPGVGFWGLLRRAGASVLELPVALGKVDAKRVGFSKSTIDQKGVFIMGQRVVQLQLGQSTALHLYALAEANGITIETLLSRMAGCLANAAGRRPGSWEAAAVSGFIDGHGFRSAVDLRSVTVFVQGGAVVAGFVRFQKLGKRKSSRFWDRLISSVLKTVEV